MFFSLNIFAGKETHEMMQQRYKSAVKAYDRYLIILILLLSSCINEDSRSMQSARQIIAQWTGREIQFPAEVHCFSSGRETTCIDPANQNYKILLYVDSVGCTSCRLQLPEWKQLIAEADSLFSGGVDFLFFFQPKKQNEKELQFVFRQNGFQYPVFIDTNNEVGRLNKFPSKAEYQCFLLDGDNKVLLIGNPSVNTGIWQLFKKYIAGGTL